MTPLPELAPLELSVAAVDGLVLRGTLRYPAASPPRAGFPLAILAHQYPATRDSYAPLAADFLAAGIATLAFDQRGHGQSIHGRDGLLVIDAPADFDDKAFFHAFVGSIARVGFGKIEDDIVRIAAMGATQNFIDAGRLALVGASIGGSGALLAAPRVRGLRAVITLGAAGAPAFGDDAPARIRKVLESGSPPAYLASSEGDAYEGAANVRTWGADLRHVLTRLVPGNAHAMAIYYDVRDELLGFIRRTLLP
jgi:alpha-beta hydrolase superfamily lysophospholipase